MKQTLLLFMIFLLVGAATKAADNVTATSKQLTLDLADGKSLKLDYETCLTSLGTLALDPSDFVLKGIDEDDDVTLVGSIGLVEPKMVNCVFASMNIGTNNVVISGYALGGDDADQYTISTTTTLIGKGIITETDQLPNLGLTKLIYETSLSDADSIKFDITAKGVVPTFVVLDNKEKIVSDPTFTSKGSNVYEVSFTLLKSGTNSARFRIQTISNNYYNYGEVEVSLKVNPPSALNEIKWSTSPPATVTYGSSLELIARTDDDAVITYSLVGGSLDDVSIVGNNITFRKATAGQDRTTIRVTAAQTKKHRKTEVDYAFSVTPKELTLRGIVSPVTKVYNKNSDATIDWNRCSLEGEEILFGDDVRLDYASATANYGSEAPWIKDYTPEPIPVTISGLSLTGTKSANYTIRIPEITGRIDKANQPDNFLNPQGGKSISGFIGGTWSYSELITAVSQTTGLGIPTVDPSNTTVLEIESASQRIKFNSAGTATVEFTASASGNYNEGSVTFTFVVVDHKTLVIKISNSAEDFKQPYKSAARKLNIEGTYTIEGGSDPITVTGFTFSPHQAGATVDGNPGDYRINYLKAGETLITAAANGLSNDISGQSTTFTVEVEKKNLLIEGITIDERDYSPNVKTVPTTGTISVTPELGDEVSVSPTLNYETANAGENKKIIITNLSTCLTGRDASNYNLKINLTGKINKASQGKMGYNDDNMTLKFGNDSTFTPQVMESAFLEYSPTSNPYAYFEAFNVGVLKLKSVPNPTTTTIPLTITAKETDNYALTQRTIDLKIEKGNQVFGISEVITKQLWDPSWKLDPQAKENPVYSYVLKSGSDVITLAADGTVTPKRAGNAVITIHANETSNYEASNKEVMIVIYDGVKITTQPVGANICQGSDYTFNVTVLGPSNASYQWFHDNSSILGATGSSYTIPRANLSDAGRYKVVVFGGGSTDISNEAELNVSSPVTIRTHLVGSKTACVGGKDTLRVSATGINLSYKWYFDNRWMNAEFDSAIVFSNITKDDARVYKVEVSGVCTSGGTPVVVAETCTLKVVSPLPAMLKSDIPDTPLDVGKSYTFKIGEPGTSGYDSATKYTWSYSKTNAIFAVSETPVNQNTFRANYAGKGVIRVELDGYCGSSYLEKEVTSTFPSGVDNIGNVNVKVYPNPVAVDEKLNIDLGNGASSARIYIYNVTGSLVFNTELHTQISNLPVNLKPGIYMLKVVMSNKMVHHKFIVK